MSKQTDKSLFIDSSVPRFYQQLLSGVESYRGLGNRIIRQIKAAHDFRMIEQVRELSGILINIPIKEYQLIAQYYLAWCGCRESNFNTHMLDHVIEQSKTYKVKALLSRGAFEGYQSDLEAASYFYREAAKAKPTLSEYIIAVKSISFIKSIEGFHESALKDLNNLIPIMRYAEPLVYYDFLNSYAVELGEAGRLQDARNVSRLVLASPFIHAYPEWQETARELKEPERAFISVPQIEREPVKATQHASTEAKPIKPGRVVPFPELKEAPKPQKPGRVTPQEFGDMTPDERTELILAAIKSGTVRESDYIKLVMTLGLLESGPASKVIDLEDEALLNDIIIVWCNMIEPDEFAAVMSALRDCEDDLRRADIIDAMIAIAFKHTHTSMHTEQEWRLSVERRLPEK